MSGDSKIIAALKSENEQLRQQLSDATNEQLNTRQIESALREREAIFRNLTETIPASIHVLQGNHFCYINSFFTVMTGYRLDECLAMDFWDLVHPDYQDVIRERAWARQRGEEVVPVNEFKIVSKSGRELWVDHAASNTIWEGKPAVIAILHDLTERKRIEEMTLHQHHLLQETYTELEEIHAELQSSQSSLLEINTRLRESEERLGFALWASDEGLWDWNFETKNLYFGDREVSMLGYLADELAPNISSWAKRVHPEDMPSITANFKPHYQGKTDFYEAEYRLLSKSGEWVWVLDRGKVVKRDADGRSLRMVGTKRYINKEKAVQAALQKSEARYRTLVETIPEIVAHSDLKGNYIWVNAPGKAFFGEDVYQHNFRDYCINQEDYQQAISALSSPLQNNEIAQLETLLRRHDGQIRILKWQSKTLSENGKFVGILSTARDITEKRTAELMLQESEARYRHLFEKSPVGLLKIDLNGNILDANEYYVKINGAPSKEAVTSINLFEEAGLRTDVAAILYNITKSFNLSKSFFTDMEYTSKWGKSLCMQYKIDPLFDQDHQVQQIIVACEEISERKKAEAWIKYLSYNDSLTGLFNRAFFDEELRRLDAPDQLPLSIIIGDVNGLKLVNDTFGHLSGDKLLKNIAVILQRCCRSDDIVARWGGDEFAILLPKTSSKIAYFICEQIRSSCLESNPDPIRANIALGAASKVSFDEDLNKVISEAENIMYRNKLLESKSIRNSIISSLEASLHEKTMETREHAQRMQKLSIQFGRALDLPANEIDRLALLARLHDIGKIGIADEILNKPGPLSPDEWVEIKKHPEIGYRIVYSSHELIAIAEEILCHHERWDGSGYPEALRGQGIPLLARILTIVDAYDVMTHARSYKEAIDHEQALAEISRCSASQFDPELVCIFLTIFS